MAILQPTINNVSTENPQPTVGQILVTSDQTNNKFYSSKIVNYVESFEVDGVLKTVFFTEVNTNVNVGDRVFILNGNYDSNEFVSNNKYKKYSDGYRVLAVQGCRIVLDIDYNGSLPFETYTTKNFIFVHHVQTQKDFDYINSIKIPLGGSELKSIFGGNINVDGNLELATQNLIYASRSFGGSFDSENLNGGVVRDGFWVRVDDGVNNNWLNVTTQILANAINQNTDFSTSGCLYIIGEDFTFQDNFFRERGIYKYGDYNWKFETKFYQAYLSKVNFRSGKFKGILNDGIFGTYLKKNVWGGATWNSGVFVNSTWKSGVMNSKHTIDETSYSCAIQLVGSISTIFQTLDVTNNRGFGYNFIEDSIFEKFVLNNGNFKNCNFITASNYKNAIDIFNGLTSSFTNIINGGKYELCDLYDINASGGYFLNSGLNNSNLRRSKLVSSEAIDSTISKGYWSSEGGIRILGSELTSYDYKEGTILNGTQSDIRGTLKLYISEEDYFKLEKGDSFYISKINKDLIFNQLTEEEKIFSNIENRFILNNYSDYDLKPNVGKKISVSLKSSNENKYKTVVASSENVFPYYDEIIDGDDLNFWYKIPTFLSDPTEPQLRGLYRTDYDINIGYVLGDVVFDNSIYNPYLNFYSYYPFDTTTGNRAQTNDEAQQFSANKKGLGTSPINQTSDWIQIGTYSGVWNKDSLYFGYYADEVPPPSYSPKLPFGDVVSDELQDNYWVFVGSPDIAPYLGNKTKQILIGVDYLSQNVSTQSNFNLPSIDISTDLLGWYYDTNSNIKYTINFGMSPISVNNVNNLFKDTILGNGDLKSGIFSESTWISGDNTNYSRNVFKIKQNSITPGITSVDYNIRIDSGLLKVALVDKKLSDYLFDGYDHKVGDIVWIKSIDYVRNNISYNIDGRYKITNVLVYEIWLKSDESVDKLSGLVSGGLFVTPVAKTNNYLSLHKVNIVNSKIISGKFRRTGFQNTTFENENFKKYIYPVADIKNTELIRIINVLFNRTNNIIKSGITYKSHFVDDTFNGGTFYDSFWLNGTFLDGLFKFSVWTGGNFNGGKFVDSRESTIYSFDYDYSTNNKLWQGGVFNGGEFYNSLWVKGTFNDGRFYKSDWTGGLWNNGILGSKDLRSIDTSLAYYGPTTSFGATFTIWNNGIVENALVGGQGALDWYDGKMIGGVFTSFDRTEETHSIWYDGEFFGSSFEKMAWWKDGAFYGGKFLSEIGWTSVGFNTYSTNDYDYGWVNGNFYGGEFGSATATGPNALWYDGVMSGGIFNGKFWKDGVLLDGNFYGSVVINSDANKSIQDFGKSFYGLWNNGHVINILSDVKTDQIITTKPKDVISKQAKPKVNSVNMYGVVWRGGTFSHSSGTFNDSIWLDGEFNNGDFNNSNFNPFVDLTLRNVSETDSKKLPYMKNLYNQLIFQQPQTTITSQISNIVQLVDTYNSNTTLPLSFKLDYAFKLGIEAVSDDYVKSLNYPYTSTTTFSPTTPMSMTFVRIYDQNILASNSNEFIVVVFFVFSENPDVYFNDIFYPNKDLDTNLPFSFNQNVSCVWTGGNFNSGEFNYSKWLKGNFNDGTMSGAIWLDGVFNYGFMYNSYWESGTWRNGTWNGSPFDYKTLVLDNGNYVVDDKRTKDILGNIATYSNDYSLHLQNVIVNQDLQEISIHNFNPLNGYQSWTYSIDDQNLNSQ